MIKTILFDLDDTLIHTNTDYFMGRYMRALGGYLGGYFGDPAQVLELLLADVDAILDDPQPLLTLEEHFLTLQAQRYSRPVGELSRVYAAYYREHFADLAGLVGPYPEIPVILDLLRQREGCIVVATHPAIPRAAIEYRMKWGGLSLDDDTFSLITSLENMHYGKPSPEYYAEIVWLRDTNPGDTLMIGNDWAADIEPAAAAGLHCFWLAGHDADPPDASLVDGYGTHADLLALIRAGWLDDLPEKRQGHAALLARMAAFPAVIDRIRRDNTELVLQYPPAEREWSVRDVVCHLRDYATDEDWTRLHRIIEEDTPFLSANYDPWANADTYASIIVEDALAVFSHHRAGLLNWINSLSPDQWERTANHAIFGPTNFEEMVRFIVEHDHTHWKQMHSAVEVALPICG